ncbi:MAG: glycosyltransferase family 39 protein [Bdellovibrionota bacterium]|mgnify:CR=1 FL=1
MSFIAKLYEQSKLSKFIILIAVFSLVSGLALRTATVFSLNYSNDEAGTSLYVTGHSYQDVRTLMETSPYVQASDLLVMQSEDPNKSLLDTIKIISEEDPQHPPLYWIIAALWVKVVGDSEAGIRILSLLLSLLALAVIFFLVQLLVPNNPLAPPIAVALSALSPFHAVFAAEARDQSLLILLALLSTTLLLARRWKTYTIVLIALTYTSLFSICILCVHSAIVFMNWNSYKRTDRTHLIFSWVTCAIAFLPWLINLVLQMRMAVAGLNWLQFDFVSDTIFYFRTILSYLARTFIDFNLRADSSSVLEYVLQVPFIIGVLAVEFFAIIYLLYSASSKVRSFVCVLILSNLLPMFISDMLTGGSSIVVGRYWVPLFLGLQMAVVMWIADLLASKNTFQLKAGFLTLIFLLLIGGSSLVQMGRSSVWWSKGDKDFATAINVVNESANPVLLADDINLMIGLSRIVKPSTALVMAPKILARNLCEKFSDIFLRIRYLPTEQLYQNMNGFTIERIVPRFFRVRCNLSDRQNNN